MGIQKVLEVATAPQSYLLNWLSRLHGTLLQVSFGLSFHHCGAHPQCELGLRRELLFSYTALYVEEQLMELLFLHFQNGGEYKLAK